MTEAEAESRRAVDAFNAYHYRYTADRLAPPAGRPQDDVPSADFAARLMERVRPRRKLVQRRRTRHATCMEAMCCGGSQVEEQLELARMEVRQKPGWWTDSELLSMGVIV